MNKLNKYGLELLSKLKLKEWDKYLTGKSTKKSDLNWLKIGFPLWLKSYFNNKIDLSQLSTKIENYINTPEEALAIIEKYIGEGEQGQIVAYTGIIKYMLSIHCVPKKDKNGDLTLHR